MVKYVTPVLNVITTNDLVNLVLNVIITNDLFKWAKR